VRNGDNQAYVLKLAPRAVSRKVRPLLLEPWRMNRVFGILSRRRWIAEDFITRASIETYCLRHSDRQPFDLHSSAFQADFDFPGINFQKLNSLKKKASYRHLSIQGIATVMATYQYPCTKWHIAQQIIYQPRSFALPNLPLPR